MNKWKLVPVELTEEMAAEMECAWGTDDQWAAAINAAPKFIDESLGQDWLHDAVVDASERLSKNTGLPPQLCYAPIMFAMQDALKNL